MPGDRFGTLLAHLAICRQILPIVIVQSLPPCRSLTATIV
jgi:hypothetical protein